MPKKVLFVTMLLLLVSVQALSASCDIRCSLMGASTGGHALQTDMPMADCQGMSMERGEGTRLIASDSCARTPCGTALQAIVKSADQSDAYASKLLISTAVLFVGSFGSTATSRPTVFKLFSRNRDSRPLVQRPGSSLRI